MGKPSATLWTAAAACGSASIPAKESYTSITSNATFLNLQDSNVAFLNLGGAGDRG